MSDLLVLFNHTLTPSQERDARSSLGINKIVLPTDEIKRVWSQVPPDLETLWDYLAPVRSWLADTASPGDFVLVQGESGATFLVVNFCLENGLIPVYSTTERRAVEEHLSDGGVELRHTFCHVHFRQYRKGK